MEDKCVVSYKNTVGDEEFTEEFLSTTEAVVFINACFELIMKDLKRNGYKPEWIRDGFHVLEIYVPDTNIDFWWDFE